MSPADDSTAKSSSSVAIGSPSGWAITENNAVSGIVPPFDTAK